LGDAGTTPFEITPFQFNDGVDEFFIRSLRAGVSDPLNPYFFERTPDRVLSR
jgi:hypothetical protein